MHSSAHALLKLGAMEIALERDMGRKETDIERSMRTRHWSVQQLGLSNGGVKNFVDNIIGAYLADGCFGF
ncbi:hypothetical protein JYU34_014914 [Plutella xylostella]|uniref:Uncharacterized protein n=1 Tax=Plutella xylostella TaxID=51655 RepID=A0ABQ7Q5U9_PLUXY|nr:hypothetical protein JYU34_014914 [Plutella xylostella]